MRTISSLLKKLSAISEPISELEQLVLLSQDNVHSTLPRASAFWWGYRLRTLHSTRIAIPSLPQLLLPSQDLVDLQLHEIPGDGYFPPEAFAYALCGMSQLETLSLHFLSLPPRRNYPGFPPPPGDRIALPALSRFKYRGISKYLDSLVARIDAPRLEDIDITFFNQPTLDASQLGLFVDRIETWSSSFQVDILSSAGAISITITQPGALKRLVLQISCEQLDWQLSSITQIFDHFSTFLSSVEDLGIEVIRPSSVPDNVDDQQWRGLIRAFDGVKDFRVTGKLTIDIIRALNPADEGEKVVLPALRYIYAQERTAVDPPLASQDSVKLFLAQRQLSNRPVGIYYGSPQQRQQQLRQQQLKQRVMQAQQDSLYARQLNILVAQGQQQQNGFASRVGQNLHPPEMGLPQGQGSLQQNFIQPSPSVPPANLQSSVAPSASQPTPPGGTQIHSLPKNFIDMPVPQLSIVYGQLMRTVEEGEKNLNAAGPSAGGEGEMQRQAFRARLDSQKQLLVNIRELINLKRQGGDPAQQAVNGAWLGAGQRATGLYSVPERPPQHNSPLNQASVNQLPPQGRIPTPQQNFGPSVTAQSNLTQMSPHVTVNGPFTPMPGAPPQLTTQCSKLPPLPEDRFKALFTQFANTTGLRLNDRDFIIDGRSVSPWALHRAVFARNGFDSVTTSDEWPAVGATLGFPPFPAGSPTQPRRCALTIAHRLLKLYNDYLRHFEQTCIDNAISQQRAS
ncbi:hypothetical protein H4582DRAFT_1578964 [Lactarius indigo]|nr:hypothetical protein H4582DRAFT_1578964 [Lactarius indigo]